MLLNDQIENLIDRNGVSSVLEAVIHKLNKDYNNLVAEYPHDCKDRAKLSTQLVSQLSLARRIQN
jgi:hypothetical protein